MKHIYFDIKFKMKGVNDKLDYIYESDKKKGYNPKDQNLIFLNKEDLNSQEILTS